MSATAQAKAEWLREALGYTQTVPPRAGKANDAPATWRAACDAWRDANDTVNVQISALRTALLAAAKSGENDADEYADALVDIAEKGLNALTEDHRVKLQAAVMEIGTGSAAAMQKSGAKTLAAIETFQAFLDRSEKIAACDANPFGAPVSIRGTLGPALRQLAAALQTATR